MVYPINKKGVAMSDKFEYCRFCGVGFALGKLSRRGLCPLCAKRRLLESIEAMRAKSGPMWERWKDAYLASYQRTERKLRGNV